MVSDPDTDDEETWQQARPGGPASPGRSTGEDPGAPLELRTLERIVRVLLVLVVLSLVLSTVAIVLLVRQLG